MNIVLTREWISAQKNTFALGPEWGPHSVHRQADKNKNRPP